MGLVYATYVPNAPFLISPAAFDGVGEETVRALRGLRVPERFSPQIVVVSSPHWLAGAEFLVNESPRPRQIYDFSGFPPSLSEVKYEPPGDPELARALVTAAKSKGVATRGTQEWGLDHGAWAPLLHLFPDGKEKVVPMSISNLPPATHFAFGSAIRPLLDSWPERIAFVATGSITHDFDRYDPRPDASWPQGEAIETEILELVRARQDDALLGFDRKKWSTVKPEGNLGPLFTLLGAVPREVRPKVVHRGSVMGGFGMSILEFVLG
ncbi:MAG: class III extradiol ring-cleavage dioxygenase [Thermoplasmata archaeon]|jgi:4,5-DOPA dioxygenase extradiol